MGTNHRARMVTAALHLLMVFLPNRTMARIENENAAKLHNRATTPVAMAHKYTLHRYRGLGSFGPTAIRTVDVTTTNIKATATRSPESRRLTRKRRISPGMDVPFRSARIVNPIISPATSVATTSRMEKTMKPGLLRGPSFSDKWS